MTNNKTKPKKKGITILKKNYGEVFYRTSIIGIILIFSLLTSTYATDNPSDNLDFWSGIKLNFFKPLTIEGQNSGCSVYPDTVRKSVLFPTNRNLNPTLISLSSKLSDKGKYNIYAINSDGSWKFLKEKDYGESYLFYAGKEYSVEYYNCPDSIQKSINPKDCSTPDNKEQGDIICKGNSYLAAVNFDVSSGTCKVEYDKVKSCDYGCDFSSCNDQEGTKVTTELITHNSDGSSYEVWSDKDISNEYVKVDEQLEGLIIDIESLNKELETQRAKALLETEKQKLEDEINQNNAQINSLEQDKQNISNDKPTNYLFYGFVSVCVLGVLVLAKKRGMF